MQRTYADSNGQRRNNYHPMESEGIACGLLISALHLAGIATLTHTPSPMKFMNKTFQRPAREKPYLLLVAGYPADDCQLPDIDRKSLADIHSVIGRSIDSATVDAAADSVRLER